MSKLKYGNLTYISENPLEFGKGLRIEFKGKYPTELYKYYSASSNNFNAVKENLFYCSHPYHFNDLTDSTQLSYNFKNLSYENYKVLFLNLEEDSKILSMYNEDKKHNFSNYRNIFYSLITQKLGVICLTSNEMNNLMWGHYSGDSGFKIKFETKKLLESINSENNQNCMFFPINYIKNKLHISTEFYGNTIPLLVDISTKVMDWKYENEWRIVVSKNDLSVPKSLVSLFEDYLGNDDRYIKYNSTDIKEIVLGFNFFNGKNFENLVYKSKNEYSIDAKSNDLVEFLKFICNSMNGEVLKAGLLVDDQQITFKGTESLKRSTEKLKISHVSKNTFVINRNNRESVLKYE